MIWFWILPSVFTLVALIYVFNLPDEYPGGDRIKTFYFISAVSLTALATKGVVFMFHLVDDVIFILKRAFKSIFQKEEPNTEGERISRGSFLTQLGVGAGALALGSFIHGVTRGKYNYRVANVSLTFPDLPEAFNGVKILQISDMHIPHFKSLKSKRGKFSILGNHDYGDYGLEKDTAEYYENLARLKAIHGEMGFDLLLDRTTELEIEGETIDLIGVENWGRGRFPKYGDFKRATPGVDLNRFNILLSHDPTHWEDHIMNKENVNLTLSGHTHGFQLGVGLGNFKWSPASLRFDRWKGLYEENGKYLYVNTGFGFLGFPGRVNMAPEITVFTLNKG